MKNCIALFLSLLCLLPVSALAATEESQPAGYDLLTDPASASSSAPDARDAPAHNTDAPLEPVDGSGDVPVDESTYQEEPPGDYTPVQRQPGRGTVDDICAYWEENGYPDDVSYAYMGGGEMIGDEIYDWWEIGLVGNDPARQQEILDLVSPTSLVEFRNALFSHAQKQAAYDTITELAVTDSNILSVIFTRNDDTVWVAVPEELAKDYAQYLIRDLDLGAVVSLTDEDSLGVIANDNTIASINTPGIVAPGGGMDTAGIVEGGPAPGRPSPLWVCAAVAVLAAALAAAALRRRTPPGLVTAEGTVHTSAPLTRRQVAGLVADAVETPDPAVYTAIKAKVKTANEDSDK